MEATLLLCDSAQVSGDKLFILGGVVVHRARDPAYGFAILVQIDWNESNQEHQFRVELQDSDGHPVLVGEDQETVAVEGAIEVGRPPGHPIGTPLNVPLSMNFGPLPLAGGNRYVWSLTVDGDPSRQWSVGFNVRA